MADSSGPPLTNPALERLPGSAFVRLRALLDPVTPMVGETLAMSIGEPQLPPPAWMAEIVAANAPLWNRYPPNDGTPELRAACAVADPAFGIPAERIDPSRHVLSATGSREALFLIALTAVPPEKNGRRPTVLMPNPYYQVYRAAAEMSGAEPVLVPAAPETGYLPDYAALPAEILERAALAIVCSPSHPEGAVADLPRLTGLVGLARRHGFLLACDECYSELYFGDPPPSGLNAALAAGKATAIPSPTFWSSTLCPSAPARRACVPASSPGMPASCATSEATVLCGGGDAVADPGGLRRSLGR